MTYKKGLIPLSESQQKWVDDTLDSMDERRLIGQLLMPCLTEHTADPLTIEQMVEKYAIAGGHVFRGDLEKTSKTIDSVRAAAEIPLLISGDLENGAGTQIHECVTFPSQMGIGASGDESLAYTMGEAIAKEGLAIGFNWVFGPVVDVGIHPGETSHTRVLGGDPQTVANLSTQILRGVQDNGMAACAKHFPGSGLDDKDSHITTPINPLSADQWPKISGLPFKAAIDAGVYSIMTGHIALPSLDSECGDKRFPRPATISDKILIDLLRHRMGFEGVVITDALSMAGVTMHRRRLELLLDCINSGNDMLLFVRRLDSAVEYLLDCLKNEKLTRQRLYQAARRVLEMKARMNLHCTESVTGVKKRRELLTQYNYQPHADMAAQKSITLIRDEKKIFPLKLKKGSRIANVCISNTGEFNLPEFGKVLTVYGMHVETIVDPATEELFDRIEAGEFDLVITSLYYPPQWGWGTTACHGPQSRCLMSGYPFANPDTPAVFISYSNPFHLTDMAFMDPFICTWGASVADQRAVAKALLGEIPFSGRSPVRLENFFEIGDGSDGL